MSFLSKRISSKNNAKIVEINKITFNDNEIILSVLCVRSFIVSHPSVLIILVTIVL